MLSTLDVRAEDRGVTLPVASALLTGVLVCCTLGVGGSDLTVDAGDGLGAVDFVEGVALPASRGVSGVRACRCDASAGFNGLDRSEDIAYAEYGRGRI